MFLKDRYYRHKQTGDRFLCIGETLTTVLLAIKSEQGWLNLNPISIWDATQYLEIEEFSRD